MFMYNSVLYWFHIVRFCTTEGGNVYMFESVHYSFIQIHMYVWLIWQWLLLCLKWERSYSTLYITLKFSEMSCKSVRQCQSTMTNKSNSIKTTYSHFCLSKTLRPKNPLKPQSDIHCNRSATSPRLTIFTDRRGRNKVPDRSRRGCREVGDWSGTSLRPNQSQPGFCACTKTWLRLIWSQTGPGEVTDQSPISRRLAADRSPTNFIRIGAWLSLKLVGDWSAIGRRLVGDRSATGRRSVGD